MGQAKTYRETWEGAYTNRKYMENRGREGHHHSTDGSLAHRKLNCERNYITVSRTVIDFGAMMRIEGGTTSGPRSADGPCHIMKVQPEVEYSRNPAPHLFFTSPVLF
jgi:hypothetical protein